MRNKTLEENFEKFCEENKINFATAVFVMPDENILVCGRKVFTHPLTGAIAVRNTEFIRSILGMPKFSITKEKE